MPGSEGNLLNPTKGLHESFSMDQGQGPDSHACPNKTHALLSPNFSQYFRSVLFLKCKAKTFRHGLCLTNCLETSGSMTYGAAEGDSILTERLMMARTRGEKANCLSTGESARESYKSMGACDSKNLRHQARIWSAQGLANEVVWSAPMTHSRWNGFVSTVTHGPNWGSCSVLVMCSNATSPTCLVVVSWRLVDRSTCRSVGRGHDRLKCLSGTARRRL